MMSCSNNDESINIKDKIILVEGKDDCKFLIQLIKTKLGEDKLNNVWIFDVEGKENFPAKVDLYIDKFNEFDASRSLGLAILRDADDNAVSALQSVNDIFKNKT
ncbi:MAG: DUF3226 domain-containing protein [Candidatus Puniceispirillales bacterium]